MKPMPSVKKLMIPLLALFAPHCQAQNADKTRAGNDIVIGKIDSLYSASIGEQRTVWIHVPHGYNKAKDSTRRYPVVYLLDGDGHFTSVVGMIERLSEASGNDICPDMIVVGITNTHRTLDLTPTADKTSPFLGPGDRTGGGEKFLAFIGKELIPHIDSLYPTAPYRVLIGHSLGGLIAIHALYNHTDLFNAYLAIDPSLWWDNQHLLKQTESEPNSNRFRGRTLFLAVANTMSPGEDTLSVQKDTGRVNIHIRSILRYAKDLHSSLRNGLRWSYKYYDDDSHGSVPLIAEYDGLRFIFDYYAFHDQAKVFDPAYPADSAVRLVVDHYRKITEQMGYTVLPAENQLNGGAKGFLQGKIYDKAYAFYKLDLDYYPKSVDANAGMGDYYAAKGDKKKALEYYNVAMRLGDKPDWVLEKIEKLSGEIKAPPGH
jgi:uncharacterized protein